MECPYKIPVRVIETNGHLADADDNYFMKILFRGRRDFELKMQQLHYAANAINSHEKLVEALKELKASDNWLHRLLKSCVIFLDDGEVTKRAVEKQSRYNQQALKEAEQPK